MHLISILSFTACSNYDDNSTVEICRTVNLLEDLDWLNQIKLTFEADFIPAGSLIIRYSYKGEDVFWIDGCVNCEDALIQIHNCNGEVICQKGGLVGLDNRPDFESEATNPIILFDNVQQNNL